MSWDLRSSRNLREWLLIRKEVMKKSKYTEEQIACAREISSMGRKLAFFGPVIYPVSRKTPGFSPEM